ncbi:major facilitator superfamily transporter [Corynespora cassiicola Philippines]|uniref:Major facilitator superfamily transporter n=1 Tax=Corynespora cassiicola Philippines TaxID=1448308 RepID=A0A2T2NCP8_CORCC|nr:major facilitator superfamily transporter [Corynespora cassiicola Philippines]
MSAQHSWSEPSEKTQRRYTTLEGWKELSNGVYASGPNVRKISVAIRNQFDPEIYEDDRTSLTCPSISEYSSRNSNVDAESIGGDTKSKYLSTSERPYHVFSQKQKWGVVAMIGVAGLFSGLSSNIYFPALDAIANDLHVSSDSVSLTITSYLIVQGLSPLIWGPLSDNVGRRPIYLASFGLYIISNIALSFSPSFVVLLAFRGLQAAGSASTVSIVRNFSIAAGPILGGALANSLGFRAIFIFLVILSSLVIIAIFVFLPETLRSIAGDGRLRLTGIYQPLIRRVTNDPPYLEERDDVFDRPKVTTKTFTAPFLLLKEKDILMSLVFGGFPYAIWSMVTSSTTSIFKDAFHLNELLLGLAFIPNGLGTIAGSTIIGNLMNQSYIATEKEYKKHHNLPLSHQISKSAMPLDFPIEHARLCHIKWITAAFVLSTSLYGLSFSFPTLVSKPGWIAIPLILQFLIAATSNAVFAINQTLISDLCPGKGASSTAVNNLVRCSIAAGGVAIVDRLIAAVGIGATFFGLGLVMVSVTPLAIIQWYWGEGWRRERMMKQLSDGQK